MIKFEIDDEDDDYDERPIRRRRRRAPEDRTYVHSRCGGLTRVGGADYIHISDPFWPCTATYCCTCEKHVPLRDVRWADTRERISEYRRRLRAEAPWPLKVWRYGLGYLIGGLIGVLIGQLLQQQFPQSNFELVGGITGTLVCVVLGTMILNRVFDIDYRCER